MAKKPASKSASKTPPRVTFEAGEQKADYTVHGLDSDGNLQVTFHNPFREKGMEDVDALRDTTRKVATAIYTEDVKDDSGKIVHKAGEIDEDGTDLILDQQAMGNYNKMLLAFRRWENASPKAGKYGVYTPSGETEETKP